jgi:hypothetical protein
MEQHLQDRISVTGHAVGVLEAFECLGGFPMIFPSGTWDDLCFH